MYNENVKFETCVETWERPWRLFHYFWLVEDHVTAQAACLTLPQAWIFQTCWKAPCSNAMGTSNPVPQGCLLHTGNPHERHNCPENTWYSHGHLIWGKKLRLSSIFLSMEWFHAWNHRLNVLYTFLELFVILKSNHKGYKIPVNAYNVTQ